MPLNLLFIGSKFLAISATLPTGTLKDSNIVGFWYIEDDSSSSTKSSLSCC